MTDAFVTNAYCPIKFHPTILSKNYFEPDGGITIYRKNCCMEFRFYENPKLLGEFSSMLKHALLENGFRRISDVKGYGILEGETVVIFPERIDLPSSGDAGHG